MEVEINFRKTAQENAEKYFKRAKQAKQKILASEKALEKTLEKIENYEVPTEKLKKPRKRVRKKWYNKFHWEFTTENFLVIAGRNATQNEMIFKKHMEPNDIILHADVAGAPLTVIKSKGKDITPLAVREAAEVAAAYSSAWKAGLSSIDVYWIRPDQVSKTAPAGEYLPKGAFMIRGKKNYLKKRELKIAIGVEFEDKQAKLISGNIQAINEHANYFVTIKPGEKEKKELAKEIKLRFLQKALPDHKEEIEKINLDDIQKLIPTGNGNIFG